jgi:TRAP-type C4-dicarboxylate transport system permease small subunit
MTERWERIDAAIGRVEQALLVVLLSVLILIAFSQIILRNFFSTGIAWGDALVRSLVLWTGFIGATIAAREGQHISIDVVIAEGKEGRCDYHPCLFIFDLLLPDLCRSEIYS